MTTITVNWDGVDRCDRCGQQRGGTLMALFDRSKPRTQLCQKCAGSIILLGLQHDEGDR